MARTTQKLISELSGRGYGHGQNIVDFMIGRVSTLGRAVGCRLPGHGSCQVSGNLWKHLPELRGFGFLATTLAPRQPVSQVKHKMDI